MAQKSLPCSMDIETFMFLNLIPGLNWREGEIQYDSAGSTFKNLQ